jgi:uncharacterized repeat protein (TIGR03803 family)
MTKLLRSWISQSWISRIPFLATSIVLVLAVLATPSARGQAYTETVLYSFMGGTDGAGPFTHLIMDAAGNLYGTTPLGGVFQNGTVFKVDTSGHETVLHTFSEPAYGAYPYGRLTMDAAGNLFGTTYVGGAFSAGTVFKLDTSGVYTVLYNFSGYQDGGNPQGGLLLVEPENYFLGMTTRGGYRKCFEEPSGCGIVYKLAPNSTGGWTETVLHTFTGAPDGSVPLGELTRDAQGFLYGTTQSGGASNFGTVFKLRARQETVLYSFTGAADGASPQGTLVRDAAGNLYGTAGGGNNLCSHGTQCGVVFKLDTSGHETVFYAFKGGTDGAGPNDRLVNDAAGNLYGTTYLGGDRPCCGTVFKLDTTGTKSVLHSFTGIPDGKNPMAGLAMDAAGNVYGTTYQGGLKTCHQTGGNGCGIVFKLAP